MEDFEIAILGSGDEVGGMTIDESARSAWKHQGQKEFLDDLLEWTPEEIVKDETET